MPSLGLGLGLQRPVGSLLDSDIRAFANESGATDLAGLKNLVAYLKGENLYSNFVIYPMKSAQNAGSGSVVYSLGGLTTNNMTLVSLPTWSATGITFDGVADYGHIEDFLNGGSLTTFNRATITSINSTSRAIWGIFNPNANNQSVLISSINDSGNLLQLIRSSDGSSTNREVYRGSIGALSEQLYVNSWTNGGGRNSWQDKSSMSLSLVVGSAQTSRYNASSRITVGAVEDNTTPQNFWSGQFNSSAVYNGILTTTQRESVTDLINAL